MNPRVLFYLCMLSVIILGLFLVPAESQSCPVSVQEKKGLLTTLEIRLKEANISLRKPKFFVSTKKPSEEVKLFQKDSTSPVQLRTRQYGHVLMFWPKKPLGEGEYILAVGEEKYPLRISH